MARNVLKLGTRFAAGIVFAWASIANAQTGFDGNPAGKNPAAPMAGSKKNPASPAGTAAVGKTERQPLKKAPARPDENNASMAVSDDVAAPEFTPMLATTGTPGAFTVETGETLPKKGFAFSVYGNKFGRNPGSATFLDFGFNGAVGVTDRFTLFLNFDPHNHVHLGNPFELSLNTPTTDPFDFGPFPGTTYRTIQHNGAPAYVEDYPYASVNGGGVGTFTLGLKYGLLSERRGAPVSLALRNDFVISTISSQGSLLANGTQSGQFNDTLGLALSKKFSNVMTPALNLDYTITRDPRDLSGAVQLTQADQFHLGLGFIMLPESRIQPMAEYNATIFTGSSTQNTAFGARDPVDGVWGVRIYATKQWALDLGYRYMMNLADLHDRHGFVIKLGGAFWPGGKTAAPPENHSPVASCSTDKNAILLDSGEMVIVNANASDPDNDPLTYTWSASGGRVDGSGPQVRWLSAGAGVGVYTITVHVDDGRGGAASCGADVRVNPKPNHPPVITCSADRPSVFAGERVHITCDASDPDNDPLTFSWQASAGKIDGKGPAGDFDTTGLSPAHYNVDTSVSDGRGGTASASTPIEVKEVPPPPQASKMDECLFGKPLSARIDNVCKRILDNVALRLENDPHASAVIIGFADPHERIPEKLASDRAENAVKYLGEKGIDPSRVKTRTGSGQAGEEKKNRRIDIIWVPEGASF